MASKIFPLLLPFLLFFSMLSRRIESKPHKLNVIKIDFDAINKHQNAMDCLVQYRFHDERGCLNYGHEDNNSAKELDDLTDPLSRFIRKTLTFGRDYRWLIFFFSFFIL